MRWVGGRDRGRMQQRRWWSRSVTPEHFLTLVQISTRSFLHSRTFCARPPSCPTLSRTGTRSDTPQVTTAAHRFGRRSPSPLAATPPAARNVRTAVCSPAPLAIGAGRQDVLAFTVQGLSLLTRVGGHHRAKQQHAATTPATSAPPPPHHHPVTHAFSTQTPPRPPPSTSHRPSPSMPLAHQTRLMVAHALPPPLVHG